MSSKTVLVTIKVSTETRWLLKVLAAATEQTMQDAVHEAVKARYDQVMQSGGKKPAA